MTFEFHEKRMKRIRAKKPMILRVMRKEYKAFSVWDLTVHPDIDIPSQDVDWALMELKNEGLVHDEVDPSPDDNERKYFKGVRRWCATLSESAKETYSKL